jgi:hypothetical protein
MLVIFDFNQSKNNSIYSYGIINIIWYYKENMNSDVFIQFLEQLVKSEEAKVSLIIYESIIVKL